jgi:drug/metabolite transporter (DMT)-like permease
MPVGTVHGVVDLAAPGRLQRARRQLRFGPYAAVWLAVAGWSTCALLVRAAHADALRFTTWRLWFALPPLFALVALRARRRPRTVTLGLPGRSPLASVAALAFGGVLFAGGAATAFAALGSTTLLDATLIPALQPVVVIGAAVVMLHERVSRNLVVRCVVAVVGTALVAAAASGQGSWSLSGDLMAVMSLFVNSGWHLYGRWMRHRFAFDPLVLMAGTLTFAALFMTPLALIVSGGLAMDAHAIGYAALVMVVGTGAHVTMLWAHRWVPASASAPILLVEPAFVAVAGWVVFGDALGGLEIVGSIVVVSALVGVARSAVTVEDDEDTLEPSL